jgi:hypothetical protein
MDTSLYLIAQAGFVLLTVIYLVLFVFEIKKGVAQTSADNSRKKAFIIKVIAALLLWMVFVTAWSVFRKNGRFFYLPLQPVASDPHPRDHGSGVSLLTTTRSGTSIHSCRSSYCAPKFPVFCRSTLVGAVCC